MNQQTAELMTKLTTEFYHTLGASFYATRAPSWPGWEVLLDTIVRASVAPMLVDVAAGNGRFGRALLARAPQANIQELDNFFPGENASESSNEDSDGRSIENAHGHSSAHIKRQSLDVARALQTEGGLTRMLKTGSYDAAVSLAFMHHLPTFEQRKNLLLVLLEFVHKNGIVGVSFWQFAYDEKLRVKAEASTKAARSRYDLSSFGTDDYLMGWNGSEDAFRFCHHTSNEEVDELLIQLGNRAELVDSYVADGSSGKLNRYVILKRV